MPKLFIRAEAVRLDSWNSKPKVSRSRKPLSVACFRASPTRPVFVFVVARASFTSPMFSPKLLRHTSWAISPMAASSAPVAPVCADSILLPAMKSVPICSMSWPPFRAAAPRAAMAPAAAARPAVSAPAAISPALAMASPRALCFSSASLASRAASLMPSAACSLDFPRYVAAYSASSSSCSSWPRLSLVS